MKKRFAVLGLFPLLCSCSGRAISNEEAYRLITGFEIKLDQMTTFSFYERKSVAKTETTCSTSLYQVFFEDNYIHSYVVNEDYKTSENNYVLETWSYIDNQMIYEVQTNNDGMKDSYVYAYQKDLWEAKIKEAFNDVRSANLLYTIRLKNEIQNQTSQTIITSHSKNESQLYQKIEKQNKDGKTIRTKTYEFDDYLIKEVNEINAYSTTKIVFSYKVTTQEPNIPDLNMK